MKSKNDILPSQKYGRWTVLQELRVNGRKAYECRCDCGTVRIVRVQSIRNGRSKSCGCLLSDRAKKTIIGNSKERIETNAAFHTNFCAIERREPNKNNKSGHRGIYYEPKQGLWKAYINVKKKHIYLGGYHDIRDAIRAREDAEKQYFLPLIEAKNLKKGTIKRREKWLIV
jgi:hypothetical protein